MVKCEDRIKVDFKFASDSYSVANDDVSDSLSVDTREAFLDMLGLSSLDFTSPSCWDNIDNNDIAKCNSGKLAKIETKSSELISNSCDEHVEQRSLYASPTLQKIVPINLPKKASRHHYAPSSCLALVVDDVLSPSDCQKLINITTKFRYITEATHTTADGSSYMIQIQNPNPHKLAVIDTRHSPSASLSHATQTRHNPEDFPTSIMDHLFDCICDVLYSLPEKKQPQQQQPIFFENFLLRERCGRPKGLNPRMRILKYDARDDDRFDPHFDATTYVSPPLVTLTPTSPSSSEVVNPLLVSSNEDTNSIEKQKKRYKSLITVLVYLNDGSGVDFEGGETVYLDYHDSTTTATVAQHVEKVAPKAGRIVLFEHDLFHSGAPLSWGTKYIMRTDVLFDEEATEGGDGSCANNTSNCSSSQRKVIDTNIITGTHLLHEVCNELNLSIRDKQILDEMGLLNNITCESFLSPGIVPLKLMLVDGGMKETAVNFLIKKACELVQS